MWHWHARAGASMPLIGEFESIISLLHLNFTTYHGPSNTRSYHENAIDEGKLLYRKRRGYLTLAIEF